MSKTAPRVLLVDDEPHILDGLRRMLRNEFTVDTASDPVSGLEQMAHTTYSVVMSDFQMPQMNGAQFLAAARLANADTARILLTGQADLAGAAAVVNEGGIMRMLLKPAGRDQIVAALHAGVEHHRLITAERDLLDNTLRGSIRALTEVLSLANPTAFERSTRIRDLVAAIATAAAIELPWHAEIAAMLGDLGAIAAPPDVLRRAEQGHILSEEEQSVIDQLPFIADQILTGIPRIDEVRAAILDRPEPGGGLDADSTPSVCLLRLARAFDALTARGIEPVTALASLRERPGIYSPPLLDALADLLAREQDRRPRTIGVAELLPGMVLADDILTRAGLRLVTKGHQLTTSLVARVRNYAAIAPGVAEPIHVFVVVPPVGFEPTLRPF